MAASSFWRGLAPVWLRILAGLLVLPILWFGFELVAQGLLPSALPDGLLVLLSIIAAGIVVAFLVRKSSRRRALVLSSLALLLYAMGSLAMIGAQLPETAPGAGDSFSFKIPPDGADSHLAAPNEASPKPETPVAGSLPEFPWPPPAASASYVLPDRLLDGYRTLGDATGAILAALEQNGYVERSFFRTAPGGVALVTRLERINDDGSPSAENERWTASAQRQESTRSLLDFLQGLFFVDPGHYRVIVFVLQDLPFSQSAEVIVAEQAHAWLTSGANVLSPEIAGLPFAGGHVTVLIYEFASDGSKVQVVTSQLTGKQHLEKAGLLTVLDKVH
jgi:hypothetical protein